MSPQTSPPALTLQWPGKRTPDLDPDPRTPKPQLAEVWSPFLAPGCTAKPQAAQPDTPREPKHRVYQGENLEVLGAILPELRGKVDCIYIDPPFYSQANYQAKLKLRPHPDTDHTTTPANPTTTPANPTANPAASASAPAPAPSASAPTLTLAPQQYQDRWDQAHYLQFMYERLVLLRETLAEAGSIYLHCDWHAAASLRLVMDEVFGARNLLNEIVWSYGSGGGSRRRFGRKHDTILFYAKRAGRHFFDPEAVRVPYRAAIAPKRRAHFHPEGMVSPDVWDIPRPPNHADSWTGYPTQKPLAVVQRALRAACPPGGLVLDAFAGSGTTLEAGARLGMRTVGIERTDLGLALARRRLVEAGVGVAVYRHVPGEVSGLSEVRGKGANGSAVRVRMLSKKAGWRIERVELPQLQALLVGQGAQEMPWQNLVDVIAIDPHCDGQVFRPSLVSFATKNTAIATDFIPAETGLELYKDGELCVQVTDITGQLHWYRAGLGADANLES